MSKKYGRVPKTTMPRVNITPILVRLMLVAGCCATLATSAYEPPRIEDIQTRSLEELEVTRVYVRLNAAARQQAHFWIVDMRAASEQEGVITLVPRRGRLQEGTEVERTMGVLSRSNVPTTSGLGQSHEDSEEDSGIVSAGHGGSTPELPPTPVNATTWVQFQLDATACPDSGDCLAELELVRSEQLTAPIELVIHSWAHRRLEKGGCLSMGPTAPEFTEEAELTVTFDE